MASCPSVNSQTLWHIMLVNRESSGCNVPETGLTGPTTEPHIRTIRGHILSSPGRDYLSEVADVRRKAWLTTRKTLRLNSTTAVEVALCQWS